MEKHRPEGERASGRIIFTARVIESAARRRRGRVFAEIERERRRFRGLQIWEKRGEARTTRDSRRVCSAWRVIKHTRIILFSLLDDPTPRVCGYKSSVVFASLFHPSELYTGLFLYFFLIIPFGKLRSSAPSPSLCIRSIAAAI